MHCFDSYLFCATLWELLFEKCAIEIKLDWNWISEKMPRENKVVIETNDSYFEETKI